MAPALRQSRTLTETWSTGRKKIVSTPRLALAISKRGVVSKRSKSSASPELRHAQTPASSRRAAAAKAAADALFGTPEPAPSPPASTLTRRTTRSARAHYNLLPSPPPTAQGKSEVTSAADSDDNDDSDDDELSPTTTSRSSTKPRPLCARRRSQADIFHFLKLPPELRLMIYEAAFEASSVVHADGVAFGLRLRNHIVEALLFTCHQIYAELIDIVARSRITLKHTTLETAARSPYLTFLFRPDCWNPSSLQTRWGAAWEDPRGTLQTLVFNWVKPADVQFQLAGMDALELNVLSRARKTLDEFTSLRSIAFYTTSFTHNDGCRRSKRRCDAAVYCIEFVHGKVVDELDIDVPDYEPLTRPDTTQVKSLDSSIAKVFLATGRPPVSLGSSRVSWERFVRPSRRALVWNTDEEDQDAAFYTAERYSNRPYRDTMRTFLQQEFDLGPRAQEALLELTDSLTRTQRPVSSWSVRIFRMTL